MKLFTLIWDMTLFVFAYSTTKHCDKLSVALFEEDRDKSNTNKDLF